MHHYSYSLHHLVVTVRAAYHTRFAAHCFFFAANCLTQICSWNRTCLFTCTIYDYGVAPMTPHHNANIMHNQEATWRNSEFFPSPHELQTTNNSILTLQNCRPKTTSTCTEVSKYLYEEYEWRILQGIADKKKEEEKKCTSKQLQMGRWSYQIQTKTIYQRVYEYTSIQHRHGPQIKTYSRIDNDDTWLELFRFTSNSPQINIQTRL